MNKITLGLAFFFGFTSISFGQGHVDVFPELSDQALYEAVAQEYTPVIHLSYGEARDTLYGEVYRVNDSLHCIYTDWQIHMPPGADPTQVVYLDGQGINAEHTWPQSFGAGSSPPRADMHHLFPSRADVNQARGSLKFGEVPDNATDRWYYLDNNLSSPPTNGIDNYSEYQENVSFEPREVSKGNIARAIFYFNTIYRTQANNQGTGFFDSQRAALCQWHLQDPIDEIEWERTYMIASHQSNKPNPFIIDCTLAARMYCPEIINEMCITTTTSKLVEELEAKAFPNPSKGLSRIIGFAQEGGLLEISYLDVQGKVIQSEKLQVNQGQFELDIALPFAGFWQCRILLTGRKEIYLKTIPLIVLP